MKTIITKKLSILLVAGLVSWPILAEDKVIADFDIDQYKNNLGGGIDAFDGNPDDPDHTCKISFDNKEKQGEEGYSLKIDYLLGENTKFNGVLIYLNGLDLTPYKKINFWIKGNKEAGFPKKFILELKTETGEKFNIGRVPVRKISSTWQKVSIPLDKFKLDDLKKGQLFAIVFEEQEVKIPKGTINIDNMTLSQ